MFYFIMLIADSLPTQIDWESRFMDDNGCRCKVTLDGTDFKICEPRPFDPIWYSEKFNGPALQHETGMCIQTGWIVWVNGPFPAGLPDRNIAREWTNQELQDGECYLADGGYCDGLQYAMTPTGLHNYDQYMKKVVSARHEAVNGWFK